MYGGGRESWGSAEGIGLGSRCVCLMSSCGERKEKGGREIFSKDFLPSNPISLFLPSCLLHMSAIRQNSFSLVQRNSTIQSLTQSPNFNSHLLYC